MSRASWLVFGILAIGVLLAAENLAAQDRTPKPDPRRAVRTVPPPSQPAPVDAVSSRPPGELTLPPCGFDTPSNTTPSAPVPARPQPQQKSQDGAALAKTASMLPTQLVTESRIAEFGAPVELAAVLKLAQDGQPVSGLPIRFRFGMNEVGSASTDATGTARLLLQPDTWFQHPVSDTIQAEFLGTSMCGAAKSQATLAVLKAATKIELEQQDAHLPIREGTTLKVRGQFMRFSKCGYRCDDYPIGREIIVTVDGKEIKRVKSGGIFPFNIDWVVPKGYLAKSTTLEAGFEGDKDFAPSGASLPFTIHPPLKAGELKPAYLLTSGSVKGQVGETVTFTARLGTSNPPNSSTGISGVLIRFGDPKPNGHFIGYATTNATGLATLHHKITEGGGLYSFSAVAKDAEKYGYQITILHEGGISEPVFTVERAPVQVRLEGSVLRSTGWVKLGEKSPVKIGEKLWIKVWVRRTSDDALARDVPVALYAGGVRVTPVDTYRLTSSDLPVTFDYIVTSEGGFGPRTLEVKSYQTGHYLAGQGSVTIQVVQAEEGPVQPLDVADKVQQAGQPVAAQGVISQPEPPTAVRTPRVPAVPPPAREPAIPAGRLTQVFTMPMWDGKRVDLCLVWGGQCGEPAATEFCKRSGYTKTTAWQPAHDIGAQSPTVVLGTGQACNQPFCDGFASITCSK